MTTFYNRRDFVHQTERICDKPTVYFKEQYLQSCDYYVNPASNDKAQIIHKNEGRDSVVILSEFSCDCLEAQDQESPC